MWLIFSYICACFGWFDKTIFIFVLQGSCRWLMFSYISACFGCDDPPMNNKCVFETMASSSSLSFSCLTVSQHVLLLPYLKNHTGSLKIRSPTTLHSLVSIRTLCPPKPPLRFSFKQQNVEEEEEEEEENLVQDLRVPDQWLVPSKALQESEWLRVTLHKWLDDEYCVEETNIEISEVAARSYYESLVGKQGDLGKILLKMARDLESISYQESFHGAFSSANAAVHLITLRMENE